MANFDLAIKQTIGHEGGDKITNDPNDPGGLTKFGISQRSHPLVEIKNLSLRQAEEIYRNDYWDNMHLDEIESQAIAEAHNCDGVKTKYWFATGKHPARDEWAFVVPEGEEYNLDAEEQARLISLAEAQSQGWFPPPIL